MTSMEDNLFRITYRVGSGKRGVDNFLDVHPDAHERSLARIAAQFTRYRVPYVVIGGFAMSRYLPAGRRRPADLDVVIAPTIVAGKRSADVIASLTLSAGLEFGDYVALTMPPESLAAGEQLIFATKFGTLHLIGSHLPTGIDRTGLVRRRRWTLVGASPVAVCSFPDLLDIKRSTGRVCDEEDVAVLERYGAAQSMWGARKKSRGKEN